MEQFNDLSFFIDIFLENGKIYSWFIKKSLFLHLSFDMSDVMIIKSAQRCDRIMPRYLITTKQMKNANGIRIEPGMSVEVVTQSMTNPVLTNGGQLVVDAFMRIYGIDIRRAGILNMTYLTVERIN